MSDEVNRTSIFIRLLFPEGLKFNKTTGFNAPKASHFKVLGVGFGGQVAEW